MVRSCDACRKPYEAKRGNSRYCSAACRQRAHRSPEPIVTPVTDLPVTVVVTQPGSLTEATERALAAAGMVDSPDGQAALLLARRLDGSAMDTGSSIAAMVREHAVRVKAAVDAGKVSDDPLDQLADRRRQRLGHG